METSKRGSKRKTGWSFFLQLYCHIVFIVFRCIYYHYLHEAYHCSHWYQYFLVSTDYLIFQHFFQICNYSSYDYMHFGVFLVYLLKPRTTQNDSKPAKMTLNQLKRTKTSQSSPKIFWNGPKFQNWGNLEFYISFHFPNFELNEGMWTFWPKKYSLSNPCKIFHVSYFECTDFKFVICF